MRTRTGFSLFEVMIAMSICVAGLALILQMLGTSETLSRRAELHLKAQQHCRNLLNSYLAGILEPRDTRREELLADPRFWYAVKLEKHRLLPLETIVVDVWAKSPRELQASNGRSSTVEDERKRGEANKFRLVGNRPLRTGFLDEVYKERTSSSTSNPWATSRPRPSSSPNPFPSTGRGNSR
jgi:type II secretory pathway pseudopilin PulG